MFQTTTSTHSGTHLMSTQEISIPDFCLVVLVGVSGAGKTCFAQRHFLPTQIVSSDAFRAMVCDDENDQAASADAFELVHDIVERRLRARRLTVVDATNLARKHREPLRALAKKHDAFAFVIVLDPGEDVSFVRLGARSDRSFSRDVLLEQWRDFRSGLAGIEEEGFRGVFRLDGDAAISEAKVAQAPMRSDKRSDFGPFDIIGDVHGCCDELVALFNKLGYEVSFSGAGAERSVKVSAPPGRRAVFVGDLVDRGPASPDVLRIAMEMVASDSAYVVPGNHDIKLLRWFNGRDVKVSHGLEQTLEQMEQESDAFNAKVHAFLDSLYSHVWLAGGELSVAHAGIKENMLGRSSRRVRSFCFFGDTSGKKDEKGLPERFNWAVDYNGSTTVVYGHTPVEEAGWLNNTLCLDTGCVFGGKLTALRWPEREIVSVRARETYVELSRPMGHPPPRPKAGKAKKPA